MSAIRFLTTVSRSVKAGLFQDAATMTQICEKIVVPNLRLRDDVEETFEMNWLEYVRRDTEGSDTDTRRRAACELVRGLTEKFPTEVSAAPMPKNLFQISDCRSLQIWRDLSLHSSSQH